RRFGDITPVAHVALGLVGTIVEHGNAIADELHVGQFLGRDRGDQTVEGAQLVLRAEVEALEHVVAERRHFPVLAAEKLLESSSGIGVLFGGWWQLGDQPVYSHKHARHSSVELYSTGESMTRSEVLP